MSKFSAEQLEALHQIRDNALAIAFSRPCQFQDFVYIASPRSGGFDDQLMQIMGVYRYVLLNKWDFVKLVQSQIESANV